VNDNITPITFDDLVRMASRIKIPDSPSSEVGVRAGQLWLARWDDFAEFVLITTPDPSDPVAVPITFDDMHEIEESQVVRSSQMGEARAHWSSSRRMPAIALDRLIDADIPTDGSPDVDDYLSHGDDPLWQHLRPLSAEGSGQLPAQLRKLGASPGELSERLRISGSETLDLLRGRSLPDPALLPLIADLLSMTPAAVLAMMPPIPDGLRRGLSKRIFRDSVRALGRRLGFDDSSAWRQSAYGTLAMPYRATGQLTTGDWDNRIERFFEVDQ
jgi:hypothetical protein